MRTKLSIPVAGRLDGRRIPGGSPALSHLVQVSYGPPREAYPPPIPDIGVVGSDVAFLYDDALAWGQG